jgi:predicted DNA-binding transcriptional regulator AlpA
MSVKESRAVDLRVACDRLGMSVRTGERRLAEGTFPIPELPRHRRARGVKHRFSSVDIERYLRQASTEDVR